MNKKVLKGIAAALFMMGVLSLGVIAPQPASASEPYLGEIKIFPFNFAPRGWAQCNGQYLPINQNQALFSILGTTYGGNGQTTFALPDMRGRVPIHFGNGHSLGEMAGSETATLTLAQMPTHYDLYANTNPGNTNVPGQNIYTAKAQTLDRRGVKIYSNSTNANMSSSSTGGSQPHENMQPFLALNYCIALQGVFPSQN